MPDYLFRSTDGVFYAQLAVPAALQKAVGKKTLKRSLQTKSRSEARLKLRPVLAEFWATLDISGGQRISIDPVAEGLQWRANVQVIAGDEMATEAMQDLIVDRAYEVEDEHGEEAAKAFADVAFGRTTPLLANLDRWLSEPGKSGKRRPRTVLTYRSSIKHFGGWLSDKRLAGTVEVVTRKVAGDYVSSLHATGLSPARVGGYVTALSSYWRWLEKRGVTHSRGNPWADQGGAAGRAGRTAANGGERPFEASEIMKLMANSPDDTLTDLMMIAGLSGMRIEEICRLEVRHCVDEIFKVPGTKTANADRQVPIHSQLASVILRRCAGKAPGARLFDELKPTALGEFSSAISKRFNRYRAKLGIKEKPNGERRSLVNFHSFRRWFITEALRAKQPERVVKQLVGHEFDGDVTMVHYFGGDLPAALRQCVEAVRLPHEAPVALPAR